MTLSRLSVKRRRGQQQRASPAVVFVLAVYVVGTICGYLGPCTGFSSLIDIANMALQNSPSATRLITNKMCPFAQKAWIALEVSKTPYEMEEISLYGSGGKPDWFWKLNPAGTVPVLVCNGGAVVIPDSDKILDEIEKGIVIPTNVKLGGKEANNAAIQQWRKDINDMLPIGKKAVLSGATSPLKSCLQKLDKKVVGPYLTGDQVTVADCHAFPFLWRIEQEFGYLTDECPKLGPWLKTCLQEPGFQKTIPKSWWWWW